MTLVCQHCHTYKASTCVDGLDVCDSCEAEYWDSGINVECTPKGYNGVHVASSTPTMWTPKINRTDDDNTSTSSAE